MDKPTDTFHKLLDEFITESDVYVKHHTIGPDCTKVRIICEQIVIDMYYYPIDEHENRDWYDVHISSVKEDAHFIGSLNEFGKHIETFKKILGLANISTSLKINL